MGQLFAKFLVGGLAGLVIFLLLEPSAPKVIGAGDWEAWELRFILMLGASIGLAVGALDGFTRGGKIHTFRGLALGLLFGAVGISLGYNLGGGIVRSSFGTTVFLSGNIIQQILARTVVFSFIGVALGAAIGASSLNLKKLIQGAVGGALGGAISGAVFDPISGVLATTALAMRGQTQGEVGTPGRAVMSVMLGATIGLFIGLVEKYTRSAWVRLQLGRNEGKEWSIDGAQTFIGRSESAHIPLFGDMNIAPIHASIQRQNGQYVLVDGGSPMGTGVNGQRVQSALLMHGSQIQIGTYVLQFLMKNQAAPARGPEAYVGQPFAMPQMQASMPQPMASSAPAMPAYPSAPMGGAPTQVMASAPLPGSPTVAFQPAAPTSLTLVAIDGPMIGQRFPVTGPIDAGRDASGIRLSFDSNSSRRHAMITPGAGNVVVQDLGSTNGTFVNGQRVSQANAGPGDLIRIGATTFRVE